MPRNARRQLVGKIDGIVQERRADELAALARQLHREWPEAVRVQVDVADTLAVHVEYRAS